MKAFAIAEHTDAARELAAAGRTIADSPDNNSVFAGRTIVL